MNIYYLLIEAKPNKNNDECKEFAGAFVNCWIKANDEKSALKKAEEYIDSEMWEIINIEEIYLLEKDFYIDNPELKSCYDLACEYGTSAIFNCWSIEEDIN